MATTDVVVLSATGGRYVCRRERDRSGWLCGRCEQGVLVAPHLGQRCPVCAAEVVAIRRGWGTLSFALLVLAVLVLGWVGLTWWR